MTLDILNRDAIAAWKAGDATKKNVLLCMVDAVKKASMTANGRIEITETLVDETLAKYQKMVQEQYDTCPDTADYIVRKADYLEELLIVKQYAPQLVTDVATIQKMITAIAELDEAMILTKANRGYVMKTLAAQLKGKADMSIVNKVVGELLV
jgi:uncharacterized protein YqeY